MNSRSSSSSKASFSFFGFWQFFVTMIASSYLKQIIITVLCVLGIPSYLSAPKPISVQLGGQSSISVPANRAFLSLRIYAEGPNQGVVADEVRKTADDILATMRPLSQVSLSPSNAKTNSTSCEEHEPPIADLSVTSFRSYSWLKRGSSLLSREAQQYESSMEIEAEFRDFDVLGRLLAQVSKQSAVSIQRLKWTLDDITKNRASSRVRSEAMVDALDKVHAYIRPLGMDKVRAIKFSEGNVRSRDVEQSDVGRLRYQHDELGKFHYHVTSRATEPPETFGLEPRTLEIVAQIDGEFFAWKTGLDAWFRRGGV